MSAARIKAAALRIGRAFGVGGPSWTRTRTTAHTPAADGAETEATVTGLYIVPNTPRRSQASIGLPVFDSAYVAIADDTSAALADDVFTDGTYTFAIAGAPFTAYGFLMAPAEAQP